MYQYFPSKLGLYDALFAGAQVDDRRGLSPEELRAALVDWLPRAIRARSRPLPIRGIPLPMSEPLGTVPLAYLNDVIYPRDTWMHRIDITRATGAGVTDGIQWCRVLSGRSGSSGFEMVAGDPPRAQLEAARVAF